ncbi:GNAT family N-acetyltransferase [Parapedobacter koreensis]|uniref:Ribosomal protein S18 acetylase RimI n=1 Tax=Parapedobacter koreensis TaxID=332977 RepID=A0A1H7T4D1_9SPHI|nr:GNAT family N-acetyltransferase [Parapedobacter koreensis]SEL79146.1 Ribosomal protein S18 acetylase RimI [Parapedobacter koreensis]
MNTITIQAATLSDVETIHRLAHEIWWPTYNKLLTAAQISFMLEQIYSADALLNQMEAGQCFSFAVKDRKPIGFVGFQPKPLAIRTMRIEKLYILPSMQGHGIGKLLIDHVAQHALAVGMDCLELNVYRHNPAKAFYEKQGFAIVTAVEIPYHGYMLNDYIMQKQL